MHIIIVRSQFLYTNELGFDELNRFYYNTSNLTRILLFIEKKKRKKNLLLSHY